MTGRARKSLALLLPAAKPAGQGMLNVVLLLIVVVGTILAYPCAFKRGVFREVFYLAQAHVLSKKVCSERCVQRGVFREVSSERCVQRGVFRVVCSERYVKPEPPQVNEQILFLFGIGS